MGRKLMHESIIRKRQERVELLGKWKTASKEKGYMSGEACQSLRDTQT